MRWIDLHTHSTASDGTMAPTELARHARSRGLAAIALTDHDTFDGVQEAMAEGGTIGLEVIPGVEISTEFDPEMHILGYFFNQTYSLVEKVLEKLRENRNARNPKIVRKLNKLGFDITMEEVEKEATGLVTGRAHIAGVMVKKGFVGNMGEAFDKYLAGGRPAYVKRDKFTPSEGIGTILQAGGVPVLAHPILLHMEMEQLDALLGQLVKDGLMGLEAIYADNTPAQTERLLQLAGKHRLLVTGGSDFHGKYKEDIDIGTGKGNLRIPYELLEKLKSCL